jgi:hypothetical protein
MDSGRTKDVCGPLVDNTWFKPGVGNLFMLEGRINLAVIK